MKKIERIDSAYMAKQAQLQHRVGDNALYFVFFNKDGSLYINNNEFINYFNYIVFDPTS